MPAKTYNLEIEQGATLNRGFVLRNPLTGAGLDLTACTARMQIRKTATDTAVMAEYTSANGRILISPALARLDLNVPATTTAGYTAGYTGVYDLELVWPDGQVTRLVEGSVCVKPEVTR